MGTNKAKTVSVIIALIGFAEHVGLTLIVIDQWKHVPREPSDMPISLLFALAGGFAILVSLLSAWLMFVYFRKSNAIVMSVGDPAGALDQIAARWTAVSLALAIPITITIVAASMIFLSMGGVIVAPLVIALPYIYFTSVAKRRFGPTGR